MLWEISSTGSQQDRQTNIRIQGLWTMDELFQLYFHTCIFRAVRTTSGIGHGYIDLMVISVHQEERRNLSTKCFGIKVRKGEYP